MKFLFLILFFIPYVHAQNCQFELSLGNPTVLPTNVNQVLEQNFIVTKKSPVLLACDYFRLYFSKGNANSYQRQAFNTELEKYNYNLHSNINMSGILKGVNDALNSNEYIQGGSLLSNTPYSGSFFLSLPALSTQTNQRAGFYRDSIQVDIYRVALLNIYYQTSQVFQVNIAIPTNLNVSIVDEGGAFNINSTTKVFDFGFLQDNQELRADVIVNSNTPYQLRISSFNNGKLKKGASEINYDLKFNSQTVNLAGSSSSPTEVASSSGPTQIAGNRYNLRVKIMNLPQNPEAGVYEDALTLTAIAN